MALTATATSDTRKAICKSLNLSNPVMILKSPEKSNIVYKVIRKTMSMEETLLPLVEELRSNRLRTKKTIIFCRTHEDTSHIYLFFTGELGKEKMEPIGFPDISRFRLVDMFTSCTTSDVKDNIIQSFVKPNGRLRIIIATIAFGMGIDCPDIQRVIHWGPPSDVEAYIQETGRAGRNGDIAEAVLYYSNRDLGYTFMEDSIKDYCHNESECRRQTLFSKFDVYDGSKPIGSLCCDICAVNCCNSHK